jgi:cell division protein ZapA
VTRSTQTVAVRILDKEYQVACPPEQQAELLMSAKHLDQQMRAIRETGKVIGLERIAVMAALNISHELLRARNGIGAAEGEDGDGDGDGDESSDGTGGSRSVGALNAKLDEALHQLRQIEIG